MPTLTLEVVSLNDSGITGIATLTETGGGTMEVAIRLNDDIAGPLPTHIHEGACADLNPAPRIPLAGVRGGVSTTQLTVSLDQLMSTQHVIFIHRSTEELPVFVACADILDVGTAVRDVADLRAGHAGSGTLVGMAAGLAALSLVLVTAGRALRGGG